MNQFKVTGAKVEPGFQADYVTLITDIKHPSSGKPLKITMRAKRKTGREWVVNQFGLGEKDE